MVRNISWICFIAFSALIMSPNDRQYPSEHENVLLFRLMDLFQYWNWNIYVNQFDNLVEHTDPRMPFPSWTKKSILRFGESTIFANILPPRIQKTCKTAHNNKVIFLASRKCYSQFIHFICHFYMANHCIWGIAEHWQIHLFTI